MKMAWWGCLLSFFAAVLLVSPYSSPAQTTTAQIRGTIVDQQALPVSGARITLTETSTGSVRTAASDSQGNFFFPGLNAGNYQLQVEAAGFSTVQQTGIVLSASEERSVGSIALQVGAMTQSVTVSAEAVQVQTASGENSADISSDQIQNLQSRGRDVITLLRVLPGVTGAADNDSAGGAFGTGTPTISGIRSSLNNVTIDGQNRTNTDVTNTDDALISMDAIQEVKVLTNGYQAEYGRNAGGSVNIITKGGSSSFHGTGYYFVRNEAFNANNYFSNLNGVKRPLYRYHTFGGTVGGPVYIPGKVNESRNKLFFFYNIEKFLITTPGNLDTTQLPTQAERNGDFSQSGPGNTTSSSLTFPKDPLTGLPFPGNKIPAAGTPGCGVQFSCLNPNGQAILNYYPLPNFFNSAVSKNAYNYTFQDIVSDPKLQMGTRIDFVPNATNNFTLTLRRSNMDQRGWNQIIGGPWITNFQKFYGHYGFNERGIVLKYTRVFTPNIVNEVSAGYAATKEHGEPLSATAWNPVTRSTTGLGGLGQLFPANNPDNIIPNLSFSLPNQTGPRFQLDPNSRFPIVGYDVDINLLDNLSYTHGSHLFKTGFYYEDDRSYRGKQALNRGAFAWSVDANDPSQTGNPYADAAIGHFNNYQEATSTVTAKNVAQLIEWFGQDSWKVTPRLTLELGLRMGMASPWVFIHGDAAGFYPNLFSPSNAPLLIVPRCQNDTLTTTPHACSAADPRRGMNPATGQIVPATLIASYVPNSGSTANGLVSAGQPGYTHGFTSGSGLEWGPRFGFAWDVFGDGKTAVRGNGGIMKNMLSSNGMFVNGAKVNPPVVYTPQLYYGNIGTYLGSSGVLFPGNVTGWSRQFKVPTVYQFGFDVQHQMLRNTILDVAYVGNQARFLPQTQNLNTLPLGARFQPASLDLTTGAPVPDSLNPFNPYPGLGSVTEYFWDGNSNYNSLQVTANRRFAKYAIFGVAYTWSKNMDYGGGALPLYLNAHARNYGLSASDQTHVFNVNYTYDLPKLSSLIDNGFVREVFDGWEFSGITTFASGTPQGISYSTPGTDLLGGGDPGRVDLIGPVQLDRSARTFNKYFATQNVVKPAKGDLGNAGRVNFRGPGINNWDMNLSKTFPLASEKRNLQFRWEAYNVFNHSQFSGVNASATFNAAGVQTNPNFGRITSARNPRIMQGSLRFSF